MARSEGLLSTGYNALDDDAMRISLRRPGALVVAGAAAIGTLLICAGAAMRSRAFPDASMEVAASLPKGDAAARRRAGLYAEHMLSRQYSNDAGFIPNPMDYVYKWKHETREEDEARYPGPKLVPLGLRAASSTESDVDSCSDAAVYPPDAGMVSGATRAAWKSRQGIDCKAWRDAGCVGGEIETAPGINHGTACCGCGGGVYEVTEEWKQKLREPFKKFENTRLDTSILLLIDGDGEQFQGFQASKTNCIANIDCFGFSVNEVAGKVYYARSSVWKTGGDSKGWVTYWKRLDSAIVQCDDTCGNDELSKGARYDAIKNGVCEDGGPDAASAKCAYGTDCGDCGLRTYLPPGTPVLKKHGHTLPMEERFNFSDVVCNDLTVQVPKGCVDIIGSDGKPWSDAKTADEDGKDCAWYKDDNRCKADSADNVGFKGTSAKQSCCACGGGDTTTVRAWRDGSKESRTCAWFCEKPTERCSQSIAGPHDMHAVDACCCCAGGAVNMKAVYLEFVQDYRVPLPWYLDWEHLFGLPGLFGLVCFFTCIGGILWRETCQQSRRMAKY